MIRRTQVEEKAAVLRLAQIIVQRQSGLLTDAEALSAPQAFVHWTAGAQYDKDQILYHEQSQCLYRVVQAVAQSLESQPPGAAGMLAVYRPIQVQQAGTIEDPIDYIYGMDCHSGLYYRYNGACYLCKADMIPCVYTPDTTGMWQWEAV